MASDAWMMRKDFANIPSAPLPGGYSIHAYRHGDAAVWTMIQKVSDEYIQFTDRTFDEQFPADEETRKERIFFAYDIEGQAIGTVAAWYAREGDASLKGVVHWLAVHPAHRRQGLGRALFAHALRILTRTHKTGYLTTDIRRVDAIRMALAFGFNPGISNMEELERWEGLAKILDHPRLHELLRQNHSKGYQLPPTAAVDPVPFTVRIARKMDGVAVVNLVNASYRSLGERESRSELPLLEGPRLNIETFETLIDRPGSIVLLICGEQPERVLGCVHLEAAGDQCELEMLSINASYQQEGLGRTLLKHAETWAHERWGIDAVSMHVRSVRVPRDRSMSRPETAFS